MSGFFAVVPRPRRYPETGAPGSAARNDDSSDHVEPPTSASRVLARAPSPCLTCLSVSSDASLRRTASREREILSNTPTAAQIDQQRRPSVAYEW